MSILQDLLKANREFIGRRRAEGRTAAAGGAPARGLAVVACSEPALDDLVPWALGCRPGDAVVIRNAGNASTRWDESILRSVAAAVYLQEVKHVAVVGHAGCRMACDTMELVEGMRRAGVPRSALGDRDVREWFGLIAAVEDNVRAVTDSLKRSSFLPAGIGLIGLVIDAGSGELHPVVDDKTTGPESSGARAPMALPTLESVLGGASPPSPSPSAGAPPGMVELPASDAAAILTADPPAREAPKPVPAKRPAAADDFETFREVRKPPRAPVAPAARAAVKPPTQTRIPVIEPRVRPRRPEGR